VFSVFVFSGIDPNEIPMYCGNGNVPTRGTCAEGTRVKIWIDADACPKTIREIVYRASKRLRIPVTLVADREITTPDTSLITSVRVEPGFNVADSYLVQNVGAGDLVITADIPLAAELVRRGATGLDPRGHVYTENNIGERLATRDLLQQLRSGGLTLGGPPPLDGSERKKFAAALDRWLTKRFKDSS
jgi:uncharacterized protein YaiI (UPF0178 family)